MHACTHACVPVGVCAHMSSRMHTCVHLGLAGFSEDLVVTSVTPCMCEGCRVGIWNRRASKLLHALALWRTSSLKCPLLHFSGDHCSSAQTFVLMFISLTCPSLVFIFSWDDWQESSLTPVRYPCSKWSTWEGWLARSRPIALDTRILPLA